MQNEHLRQVKTLFFDAPNPNESNFVYCGLVFDNLSTGQEAIKHLKTWKDISFAIVTNDDKTISLYLYNKAGDTYVWHTQKKLDSIKGLSTFIERHPNNKPFVITYFARSEKGLFTNFSDTQLFATLVGYIYTQKSNFHHQHLTDRN